MTSSTQAPLASRVTLVTGANTGIGFVTARELVAQGAHVFIACRSSERAQAAKNALSSAASGGGRIELLSLDLGDLDSVRACAKDFLARDLPLHLLINNAGLAGKRGLTKSGFELAFGVNHVGHFLLTQLLRERLERSAPARIVTVASQAHRRQTGIDFQAVREPTRSFSGVPEYGVSKLANILFSAELSRQLAGTGVHTYALHPGVVASEIWRRFPAPIQWFMHRFMLTIDEGARTSLYCATSPEVAAQTGLYYDKQKVREPNAAAQDLALARKLWAFTEEAVR